QGGTALALSATAAMAGGLIGMIFLAMAAPALAELALQFGPAEYFLTALLALSLVAAVVQGSVVKGLISGGLGLMLATVGSDVMTGHLRFTFGWNPIEDGVPLIQALVGLFAVTQAVVLAESDGAISRLGKLAGGFWQGVVTYFTSPWAITRGCHRPVRRCASGGGTELGRAPRVERRQAGVEASRDVRRRRSRGRDRVRDRDQRVHARRSRVHDRAGDPGQRRRGGL